jgi:hypothetical protein
VLYYGSVEEFVRELVCPMFRRNVGEEGRADYRWAARWWQFSRGHHPAGGDVAPGSTQAWTRPLAPPSASVTTPNITLAS